MAEKLLPHLHELPERQRPPSAGDSVHKTGHSKFDCAKRRSSRSDLMTGVEPLFEEAGFAVDHRPSSNRVVMRRELGVNRSAGDGG